MKNRARRFGPRAFSLVELLITLAVISCLAAMAIFSFSDITGHGREAASRMNAKNICTLYQSARAVGVVFNSTTKEGILEELVAGKSGPGAMASTRFAIQLSGGEKAAALKYCSFDKAADAMTYQAQ